MSTFERIYQTDPQRESDCARESLSIAMSDQDYLLRLRRDQHAMDIRIISPKAEDTHAKSQSKTTPCKPKKDHPKSNAPAVESIQEKL